MLSRRRYAPWEFPTVRDRGEKKKRNQRHQSRTGKRDVHSITLNVHYHRDPECPLTLPSPPPSRMLTRLTRFSSERNVDEEGSADRRAWLVSLHAFIGWFARQKSGSATAPRQDSPQRTPSRGIAVAFARHCCRACRGCRLAAEQLSTLDTLARTPAFPSRTITIPVRHARGVLANKVCLASLSLFSLSFSLSAFPPSRPLPLSLSLFLSPSPSSHLTHTHSLSFSLSLSLSLFLHVADTGSL